MEKERKTNKNKKENAVEKTLVKVDNIKELPDPYDKVREDFFNFFTDRMKEIAKKDNLLQTISDKIREKLDNDPDPSYDTLQELYKTLSNDNRKATADLLSLFQPTANTGSILSDSIAKREVVDEFQNVYDKMSSEDLQKLDIIMRYIEMVHIKDDDGENN